MPVPPNYAACFAQAELAFIHQRVFHPELQRVVPLRDFPEEGLKEEDERWIGMYVIQPIGARTLTCDVFQGYG